jgi:hypothetical protein
MNTRRGRGSPRAGASTTSLQAHLEFSRSRTKLRAALEQAGFRSVAVEAVSVTMADFDTGEQ